MVLKVVLFGFGRAGQIHYKNLIKNKKFKLTHIVETYDISINNILDVSYVNNNDDKTINTIFNNKSIEAIIISSPTYTHYNLIKKALNNNKHVFVEKPIVEDYKQIKESFDLAKKNNLKLFVGYNRRYDNKIKNIYRSVRNGDIGFVNYALTISRDYPYPQESFLKISGGIFHDCATHDIDYMNWILNDKPISVSVNVVDN